MNNKMLHQPKENSSLWSPVSSSHHCLFPDLHTCYMYVYIHTHPISSFFLCSNGDKSHTVLSANLRFTLHQSPHTPQVSSGWPAFPMLISHSTPQQKPSPFYFPRAFKQAHFWHHLWFNSPGRNLSTCKLPGNISQDWGLEETPLPVTPPDPSGIPLFPKYHLSPCSNPFHISTETCQTSCSINHIISPQPCFKELRFLSLKSPTPHLFTFTFASQLTTDSTLLLKSNWTPCHQPWAAWLRVRAAWLGVQF